MCVAIVIQLQHAPGAMRRQTEAVVDNLMQISLVCKLKILPNGVPGKLLSFAN